MLETMQIIRQQSDKCEVLREKKPVNPEFYIQ